MLSGAIHFSGSSATRFDLCELLYFDELDLRQLIVYKFREINSSEFNLTGSSHGYLFPVLDQSRKL